MQRIFTGLEIPADVAQSLATLRGGLPGARWIDPENYHLTLRFIGDVDDTLAQEVAWVLGQVRRREFELRFDSVSSFGGRRPRAVIAALTRTRELMELQAEHERLMRGSGLNPRAANTHPMSRWRGYAIPPAGRWQTTLRPGRSSARPPLECRASFCSPRVLQSAGDPT